MDLILDTCTLLWLAGGSLTLSRRAHDLITDPAHQAWVSTVSAWEIVVKNALGRLPLPCEPDLFVRQARTLHLLETLPLAEDES